MNILSIGGSDPSSGAGIQNDIKTISSLDGHCFTVVTAITSQNTRKFSSVEPISQTMIGNQIESILSDFKIDAIKIGMVYNSPIIKAIHSKLRRVGIPIILDPVIKSTTGGVLMTQSSLSDYKKFLIPLGFVIVPNKSEAQILSGIKIRTKKDLMACAKKIRKLGAKNVIITGIQFSKGIVSDFVLEDDESHLISSKKLAKKNHGSGCTFSSTLAFCIGSGKNISDSSKYAQHYTIQSIKNAEKLGRGIPMTKIGKIDPIQTNLKNAVKQFTQIKNIHSLIPEVQTNFVFSKKNPKSLKDVVGVSGRIVKDRKMVQIVGDFKYGGSRHVGTAVITISKKFPVIRSAANIKFNEKTVKKLQRKGLRVLSYDRSKEPTKTKSKDNSTISWGIKKAIKNISRPPDVIYHKGDLGKEPMILVFGKEPEQVVEKISKLV
ncbi:MAG: bifunctional hydroxymethylpyrimidine kinase/phosphomethylpyrimidine kinase [Nitrosopumilaceae archaeon]